MAPAQGNGKVLDYFGVEEAKLPCVYIARMPEGSPLFVLPLWVFVRDRMDTRPMATGEGSLGSGC